ncbi:type IV pilus assembly protein PilW [Collimonas sp. OK307]|uniref:PilW family protein n=1 Tax=Collimonas sp. OK307 TaxID=1801620 RepID=UPI0008EB6C1E|nr:PilW family protein [Collimonas sp. OK307]SFI40883.1 type IV pilus assembly protein PilW [Collimonas sp. OK307]
MLIIAAICKKRALHAPFQCGLSLVELLVAMAIASGVLLVSTTVYLGSSTSFRLSEDKRRLYQDGNYAMRLMERDLRQAGFGNLVTASTIAAAGAAGTMAITDFILADGSPAQGLRGCEHGFVKPLAPGKDFSCSVNPGMAGFEVSYRLDDHVDPASGAGVDCNGVGVGPSAVPPGHPAYRLAPNVRIARNLFFVATRAGASANSLYCQGNGNNSAQPILNNVEDMQLVYGVAALNDVSVSQFLNATQVASLSTSQYQNWGRVVSVRLCLLLSGERNLSIEPQRYIDCNGNARLASDSKLRAVFKRVVTLRNSAAASLVPPS